MLFIVLLYPVILRKFLTVFLAFFIYFIFPKIIFDFTIHLYIFGSKLLIHSVLINV